MNYEDTKKQHGVDCECTYCDKDSQADFKELLKASIDDGLSNPVKPELYAFEGQDERTANDLLKSEKERAERRMKESEERYKELVRKQAEINTVALDGLGNIKPELYHFKSQSKDEALDLLKKTQRPATADFINNFRKAEREYPTPKVNKLTFEDASTDFVPDLPRCSDDEYVATCGMAAEWRKLSGVRPEERILKDDGLDRLTDAILFETQRKFPGLQIEWSDACYDRALTINGARTSISTDPLIEALEGLKEITDEHDAQRIVVSVVVKKLQGLFI